MLEHTRVRNEIDKNFQLGFDYAHSQVIGYHTDEARMLDPEQWATISELVGNIVENNIEEVIIHTDLLWNNDFMRGIACFVTAMRHEIYFYMNDHRMYGIEYPKVILLSGN